MTQWSGFPIPRKLDPLRQLQEQDPDVLLALVGWAEARGEIATHGYVAPYAVMRVVLNRVKVRKLSVPEIILQSTVLKGRRIWQFSFWSHDDPRTPVIEPDDPNYIRLLHQSLDPTYDACWWLAAGALQGHLSHDPTFGSTHYYNPAVVKPSWGRGATTWDERVTIGSHVFGVAG